MEVTLSSIYFGDVKPKEVRVSCHPRNSVLPPLDLSLIYLAVRNFKVKKNVKHKIVLVKWVLANKYIVHSFVLIVFLLYKDKVSMS